MFCLFPLLYELMRKEAHLEEDITWKKNIWQCIRVSQRENERYHRWLKFLWIFLCAWRICALACCDDFGVLRNVRSLQKPFKNLSLRYRVFWGGSCVYDESSIHCGVAVSLLIWFMCDLSEGIQYYSLPTVCWPHQCSYTSSLAKAFVSVFTARIRPRIRHLWVICVSPSQVISSSRCCSACWLTKDIFLVHSVPAPQMYPDMQVVS